ncbi:hypothetical protein [Rossellomorea vietnamensis]|nr:hypothetical protein [Rossellomorea vietnamensis]
MLVTEYAKGEGVGLAFRVESLNVYGVLNGLNQGFTVMMDMVGVG